MWEEWLSIYEQPNSSDKAHATFLNSLLTAGWLRFNEGSDRFLRVLLESGIAASASTEAEQQGSSGKPLNFGPLDALSKLVLLMIKFVPGEGPASVAAGSDTSKPKAQLQLLARLLAATISVLIRQYEQRPHDFNQRAYLRLFGSCELRGAEPTPAPSDLSSDPVPSLPAPRCLYHNSPALSNPK